MNDFSRQTRPSLLFRLRSSEDAVAWSEFVGEYGPVIVNWCRRRGIQEADADDIAQQVLLRLASRMRSFSYDPALGSFRAYLHTITRYAVNDFLAGQTEQGSGDTRVQDILASVAARDELLDRLDREFDHELLTEALQRSRVRVEGKTWSAFEMTTMQNVSVPETAKRLEMSIAGVYKARSRLLKFIRDELALLDPDPESLTRVNSLLQHD